MSTSRNKILRFSLAAATFIFLSSTNYAASVVSTFDSGADGWTATGDIAGPVTWLATGGNPGGNISIADAVTGGTTYFVAPAKFLGNQLDSYGAFLSFDLRQSYTGAANQFDASDIILTGAGITLVYDTPVNPGNNLWTSYNVSLTESAGWHISTLTGALPTQAQMEATLADLTDLQIRAEFQTGPDTGSLDNVTLTPEPSSAVLCAVGFLALFALCQRRRTG